MIVLNKNNHLPASLGWYWLLLVILFFVLPLVPIYWAISILGGYIDIPLSFAGIAQIGIGIYFLLVVIAYLIILLRFSFTSFIVTNNQITIATGIINRRFKSISFDQVQDVDITIGILKYLFGLGDINIWTASQSQTGGSFPNPSATLVINSKDAKWLKDFILDNRPEA
ncbi:MAG: PH domain-containing protein [Candidatus Paceibacterota bacterium]